MQLLNATPMRASYTLGLEPSGQEHVVVVVKGTFRLAHHGDALKLAPAEEQADFIYADAFEGVPGLSAMTYESEFALRKPRCDVLLNGSAYAHEGRRVRSVRATLSVPGQFEKSIDVSGDRVWDRVLGAYVWTEAVPFDRQPISYGRAYGGVDAHPEKAEESHAFMDNPVGVGFYPLSAKDSILGKPLPNTAQPSRPIESWKDRYVPMALGPIGRNFAPRTALAGTYDQAWLDDHFPFLPPDFDVRYFQSAPPDQQIDHPQGDELFVLRNLTPQGDSAFRLPQLPVPVEFTTRDAEHIDVMAKLDTVIIEPDLDRVLLIWRACLPLTNSIFGVPQAIVGRMSKGFYRARATGKQYYKSLADLAKGAGVAAVDADDLDDEEDLDADDEAETGEES